MVLVWNTGILNVHIVYSDFGGGRNKMKRQFSAIREEFGKCPHLEHPTPHKNVCIRAKRRPRYSQESAQQVQPLPLVPGPFRMGNARWMARVGYLSHRYPTSASEIIVSFAAVFRLVTQRSSKALRGEPKNGCEGD